jgi:hypothetical protein
MPEFLYQWPLWIVFVAMIGFFVGASQLMLLLIRAKVSVLLRRGTARGPLQLDADQLDDGLLWTRRRTHRGERVRELLPTCTRSPHASRPRSRRCIATPRAIPNQRAARCRVAIRAYMEQIIHQAWPQQKRGEMPTAGVAMVHAHRGSALRLRADQRQDRRSCIYRRFKPSTRWPSPGGCAWTRIARACRARCGEC